MAQNVQGLCEIKVETALMDSLAEKRHGGGDRSSKWSGAKRTLRCFDHVSRDFSSMNSYIVRM